MLAELVLIGLASWRVASLLSWEAGPLRVLTGIRSLLGFSHDGAGHPEGYRENVATDLLSCVWCLSIWIAGGLWVVWEQVSDIPVLILAASTIAVVVEESVKWLGQRR